MPTITAPAITDRLLLAAVEDVWTEPTCGGTHVFLVQSLSEDEQQRTGAASIGHWSCSRGNRQGTAPCGESTLSVGWLDEHGNVI